MSELKPKYLALGDSYTIGEGVRENERWPVQLAKKLNWQDPSIIATTGWKTFELIEAIEKAALKGTYDWVSLLIGVNNQFRELPFSEFKEDMQHLADKMKPLVSSSNHIFLLSIPDYSVTPFAKGLQPDKISAELKQYNLYLQEFADSKGYQFCSITDLSTAAGKDDSLLVEDKLHPSAKQYNMWVEQIVEICTFSP